jgi:protein-tyrosine phosphatase
MAERVLLVCTANQGRSAIADALLKAKLRDRDADAEVTVNSAGLMDGGVPASPPVVDAAARRGGDLGAHRSRRLSAELVYQTDVVVCLAREHAKAVVELAGDADGRTFTLKELVRLVEALGPRPRGEALADYLARSADLRRSAARGEPGQDDDIADPYGRPLSALEQTADEISSLLDRLVAHLWP